MKKVWIIGFCLILICAVLPVCGVFEKIQIDLPAKAENPGESSTTIPSLPTETDESTATEDEMETDIIVRMAVDLLDENSSKACKIAVLNICRNNFNYLRQMGRAPEKISISNYSDSLYKELEEIFYNDRINITYQNETVFIPIYKSGHLKTATADEYPYMTSVATPFESLSRDFKYDSASFCGVSVYGLEHITKEGYDAIKGLKYYLPNFEITQK